MKSLLGLAVRLHSLLSGQMPVVAPTRVRYDVIDPLLIPAFKRAGVKIDGVTRDKAS